MMNKAQSKLILIATVVGALLGLGIGLVLAESKKEQLQLAEVYGEDKVVVRAGFREWIAVSIAAITLIRQLSNLLTPKV
jgi:hypothetical protein